MGIFSTKKKIYVASACYNLAGDFADRRDYHKDLVVGAVVGAPPKQSLGDSILKGYLGGPGMKLRGFNRWAEDNYNASVAWSSTNLAGSPDISPSFLAPHIPSEPGKSVYVSSVSVEPADHEIWAEQWMLNNYPALFGTAWTSDYLEGTGQVEVTLADTSVHTFTPAGFAKGATYIVASYNLVTEGEILPLVTGSTITLGVGDSFPSTSGWVTVSYTSIPQSGWTETHGVYTQTEVLGADSLGRIRSVERTMYQDQTAATTRTYRIDTQETTLLDFSTLKMFIYRIGSGNTTLDALVVNNPDGFSGFIPAIPVRWNNEFLSSSHLPQYYTPAKKAYKKLVGKDGFDELVDLISDNEDLGDIDNIYAVPGVALNTKDNACRKYLYRFFANAGQTAANGETEYGPWYSGILGAVSAQQAWQDWYDAQTDPLSPLFNTPEPNRAAYNASPVNEVRVKMDDGLLFDMRITWTSIKEETGSGLAKPGAYPGEVWLQTANVFSGSDLEVIGGGMLGVIGLIGGRDLNSLIITWQTSASSWRRLIIRGLVHRNYVYGGKYVETFPTEALGDPEESGFIVPIHYETWTEMSLKDATQMATQSLYLVFNCFQIVKKQWYQRGIFKVVLTIVAVAINIIFPPAFLATASALTIAAVTVTTMVVGMLTFKIIAAVAIAIFGEKIGSIVAAVASFIMMNPNVLNNTALLNLAEFAKVDVLLSFTQAIGEGINRIIGFEMADIAEKTAQVIESYTTQAKEIADMYASTFSVTGGINPMQLVDASNSLNFVVEPSELFLTRTLMTGSDIAELSNGLVTDFASVSLNTDLPI